MTRHLRYLGLLLPLFTFSFWTTEQNTAAHIASQEARLQYTGQWRILPDACGLNLSSGLITTSMFQVIMLRLSLGLLRLTYTSGRQ